ncbi:MAG: PQQ-binding-like beta-propeller repeat protein [Eggerthellaceae bacterium]|jgi:outer membrane protein assembly factor BamB
MHSPLTAVRKAKGRRLLAVMALCLVALWCLPQTAQAADADWPSFRADTANNAVTSAPTPTTVEHAAVRWTKSFGSSWGDSPSPPIIVGNSLIIMSGTTISKVDTATGRTMATGTMAAAPSFAYTPATYADGKIFVSLSDGTIQAFDATTLESLWVYTDKRGGQSWIAPTYSDGCVYGGFYRSDTDEANFVCLDAEDGDPGKTDESKTDRWTYSVSGGFYWSNPVVVGHTIVIGTNGNPGKVVALDRATGNVVSRCSVKGSVRSSIVHDEQAGCIYFTTTAGLLYCVNVDASTGRLSASAHVRIGARSTSTPAYCGGRLYVGATTASGKGALVVVDTQTMQVCYRVKTDGPVQSSPVISTAHLADTGKLAVYFTVNAPPGGLYCVNVSPKAQKAGQAQLQRLYDAYGHEQYCVCSVAVASDGTIFYKNDSGTVFALEPTSDKRHERAVSLIEAIGTVTRHSGGAITAARKAYDALSPAEQARIPNYGTLTKAERAYANLQKKAKNANASKKAGSTHAGKKRAAKARNAQETTAGQRASSRSADQAAKGEDGGTAKTAKAAAAEKAKSKAKAAAKDGKVQRDSAATGSKASAATQALPADQPAFPWWWLALIVAAAAVLAVLLITRRNGKPGR